MNSNDKMTAKEIVGKSGMNSRPSFYSGRGAIKADLDDKILENIYQLINQEHGEKAALEFAKMVSEIPKLTATDFLLTLYALEANDWELNDKLISNNGFYAENNGSAHAAAYLALSGCLKSDETNFIRNDFLERHGLEPKLYRIENKEYITFLGMKVEVEEGLIDRAIRAYEKAGEDITKNKEGLTECGNKALEKGWINDAIRAYEKAGLSKEEITEKIRAKRL